MTAPDERQQGTGQRGGADWRDAFLCFCEEITADDFRARIAESPEISFDKLCAETRLASKCTACLLNAENVFIDASRGGAKSRTAAGATARRRSRGWSRQSLYRLIDALSPTVARTVPGIIPILAAPGISTTLSFANVVPPVIGDRAPAFDLHVETRDAEGRVVSRRRGRVDRNSRTAFDISEGLNGGAANGLVTGGCFLTYRACEKGGYLGCIRPHFTVTTPVAVTSVHSAGAGREEAYIETCIVNPAERQYVSAVNCTDEATAVKLSVIVGTEEIGAGQWSIPPRGARLLPVPSEPSRGAVFAVAARADREVRWHYVVATGDPPRISLDHM